MHRRLTLPAPLAAVAAAWLASACATGPQASPDDPLEPLNRAVFTVNDKTDQYVGQPLARAYQKVTPEPVRIAVTNFFSNLADVGNFANNLLQGKGTNAAESLMRVAINSVLGIGGLIDIATPGGLPKHSQDFGLTLGTWGVPAGPYLVLPLFGPSSIRDGVGVYVGFRLDPTTYTDPALRNSLYAANVLDVRSNLLGATDMLSLAALDKYSFVRDAYLQRRRYLLGDDGGNLPDYEDEKGDNRGDNSGGDSGADNGKAAPESQSGAQARSWPGAA